MPNLDSQEQKRLEALRKYNIVDSPEEEEFDRLIQLAAEICDVPFGKINFIDESRTWSKANYGNDIKETPREVSFCHRTIQNDSHLIVEDTLENDDFRQLPFVVESPNVRFYAGFNIKSRGYNLGTVCVLGTEPKKLTESQINALSIIASEIQTRLELKKKNKDLETLTAFLEASVEAMLIVDPVDHKILHTNSNGTDLLKRILPEDQNKQLFEIFPEWDYIKNLKAWNENGASEPFKMETQIDDHAGNRVFLEVNTISKYGKWLITFQDITKRKLAEERVIEEKKLSDAIINALPIDFYMFDEDMNLTRWNKNLTKHTGYTNEELNDLSPLEFFEGVDVKRIQEHIEKTMSGYEGPIQADLVRKDGNKIPFLFNAVSFTNNEKTYLLGTGQNISDQVDQQGKLKNLVNEKEVLLQEVHHRVKNNLAIISGFLQLQEIVSDDERTRSVLSSNYRRVKTMSLIHEELYKAKDFSGIEFDHYLKIMLNELKNSFNHPEKKIDLNIDSDPLYMNLNQAVPLALIINELVSNAYTFAFEGRSDGSISVEVKEKEETIYVSIKDDGNGLPDNFKFEESPTLGTTIVMSYSKQLKAEVEIESNEGTHIQLTFMNRKDTTGSSFKVAF
ncbi:MAG: histidine kinase dimerization/phosphoacceptor domain -containing protein [Gracilimonas sp.]|nr:histidine kinase dimerization/phosphoacceptor domain -containing protein [Gracilimonas sp.]